MLSPSTALLLILVSYATGIQRSSISFSSFGMEFRAKFSLQLLASTTLSTRLRCSIACTQLITCRTFDYDTLTKRCRLFEADSTTGSTVISSSSTSVVGTIRIIPSFYDSVHNQPCSMCQQSRYEVCSTVSNTCQCPGRSYWTGDVCALQLFENDTCTQADACRTDLNLTCQSNCYGEFSRCIRSFTNYTVPSLSPRYGVTVAGGCNGSASTNRTVLAAPADLLLLPNQTMLVCNNDGRLLAFPPTSRTAQTIATFNSWPSFLFLDNRTSNIYISLMDAHIVHILPLNRTIPPDRASISACSTSRLSMPTALIVDSAGNVYISCAGCNWVMKWAPNATNGTLVAGSSTGASGTSATMLYFPYGLALDETNSYLYVADRFNNRIQRFILGGSPNGVTVAGGLTAGAAANQLNGPTEIYLSKSDQSLYIVDTYNNRIQKWLINGTSGVTVAGSASGVAGSTPSLLNAPYAFTFAPNVAYLYVSDSNNNRIQRFALT